MPYKLRKAPGRDLYWVVNTVTKERFSKAPITKAKATAQMKALYANMKKELKGGVHSTYIDNLADELEEKYQAAPDSKNALRMITIWGKIEELMEKYPFEKYKASYRLSDRKDIREIPEHSIEMLYANFIRNKIENEIAEAVKVRHKGLDPYGKPFVIHNRSEEQVKMMEPREIVKPPVGTEERLEYEAKRNPSSAIVSGGIPNVLDYAKALVERRPHTAAAIDRPASYPRYPLPKTSEDYPKVADNPKWPGKKYEKIDEEKSPMERAYETLQDLKGRGKKKSLGCGKNICDTIDDLCFPSKKSDEPAIVTEVRERNARARMLRDDPRGDKRIAKMAQKHRSDRPLLDTSPTGSPSGSPKVSPITLDMPGASTGVGKGCCRRRGGAKVTERGIASYLRERYHFVPDSPATVLYQFLSAVIHSPNAKPFPQHPWSGLIQGNENIADRALQALVKSEGWQRFVIDNNKWNQPPQGNAVIPSVAEKAVAPASIPAAPAINPWSLPHIKREIPPDEPVAPPRPQPPPPLAPLPPPRPPTPPPAEPEAEEISPEDEGFSSPVVAEPVEADDEDEETVAQAGEPSGATMSKGQKKKAKEKAKKAAEAAKKAAREAEEAEEKAAAEADRLAFFRKIRDEMGTTKDKYGHTISDYQHSYQEAEKDYLASIGKIKKFSDTSNQLRELIKAIEQSVATWEEARDRGVKILSETKNPLQREEIRASVATAEGGKKQALSDLETRRAQIKELVNKGANEFSDAQETKAQIERFREKIRNHPQQQIITRLIEAGLLNEYNAWEDAELAKPTGKGRYTGAGWTDFINPAKIYNEISNPDSVLRKRVADVSKGIRLDYPPKARKIIEQYGEGIITGVALRRQPIQSALHTAFQLVTLGQWNKARAETNQDKLFHLGIILTVQLNGNTVYILVEKNEVINLQLINPNNNDGEVLRTIPPINTNFRLFLERGLNAIGAEKFFRYDPFSNNCQDFVALLLKANKIYTSAAIKFVKQPIDNLLAKLPGWTHGVARSITDLGGIANVAVEGGAKKFAERPTPRNPLSREEYLSRVRAKAKAEGYPYKLLGYADDGDHKLQIPNADGKIIRFGKAGYGDFIIWSELERTGKVAKGYAAQKRSVFHKSHSKIKGDWSRDAFSPNNLALKILW